MHTACGSDQQVRLLEPKTLHSLAHAGARGLNPFQMRREREPACAIGAVWREIPQHIRPGEMSPPTFFLFRSANEISPTAVIGFVTFRRKQIRFEQHLDPIGGYRLDPIYLIRFQRCGDEHRYPSVGSCHCELSSLAVGESRGMIVGEKDTFSRRWLTDRSGNNINDDLALSSGGY